MVLATVAGGAQAATLTIDGISGIWTDSGVTGGPRGALKGIGTSAISWGVPGPGSTRSSYTFTPEGSQTHTDPGAFLIGAFTHKNGTIWDYSQNPVDPELTVSLSGNLDGQAFAFQNVFSFTHYETPNAAVPCPQGPTGDCGDIVTIASLLSDPITIVQGGTVFSLFIDGFVEELGGPVITAFLNPENRLRQIYLQARLEVSLPPPAPVPLPPAAALMAGGLGILGLARLRQTRKAKGG